jgi:hypothetical protein
MLSGVDGICNHGNGNWRLESTIFHSWRLANLLQIKAFE